MQQQNSAWLYDTQTACVTSGEQLTPSLSANEVLVENHAIGINPVDWKFIRDNPLAWSDGHIPGVDGAGVVTAVGSNVDQQLIGQHVTYHAALKNNGSFATFTALDANRVIKIPEDMGFAQAAGLPCPLLTAWQAAEKIPARAGRTVLIAGLGAVNKLLVQMLVQRGLIVDVVSKSVTDAQAAQLGIRNIYRQLDDATETYFAAYDAISGDSAASLVPHLKANGHIVCIQDRIPEPIDPPFSRTISYHEIALGALHDFGDDETWQQLMEDGEALLVQIQQHKLFVEQPVEFTFEDMPKALKHSETSKRKTVLVVK